MLPLDSPRWEKLDGSYGVTRSRDFIKKFLEFLDSDPSAEDLKKEFSDFEVEVYDDLFHQQCTWSGATAAIPYLLSIAKRLPAEERCHLLHSCGVIILEHYPAKENQDLVGWYEASIQQALSDSIEFGVSTELSESSQFDLMNGIAGFEGELYIYYTLRGADWIEFNCRHCKKQLHALLPSDSDRFVVFEEDKFEYDFETGIPTGEGSPIEPVEDVPQLVRDGQFTEYATIVSVCQRGNHEEFMRWMSQIFGEFDCPACGIRDRIDMKYC